MKNRNLVDSFNNALIGIITAVKRERNLKIHLSITILILILSKILIISRVELIIIILLCALVIVAELFNTAIENVVDLYCGDEYNDLAKYTKDVAAGAVFAIAVAAGVIGFIIFVPRISIFILKKNIILKMIPNYIAIISIIATLILSIVIKSIKGREKSLLSGGMPSGHSGLAFSIATSILFLSNKSYIIILGFILAFLVAQSRYEGKIHSLFEITIGAILGSLVTFLLFKFFYFI